MMSYTDTHASHIKAEKLDSVVLWSGTNTFKLTDAIKVFEEMICSISHPYFKAYLLLCCHQIAFVEMQFGSAVPLSFLSGPSCSTLALCCFWPT